MKWYARASSIPFDVPHDMERASSKLIVSQRLLASEPGDVSFATFLDVLDFFKREGDAIDKPLNLATLRFDWVVEEEPSVDGVLGNVVVVVDGLPYPYPFFFGLRGGVS